MSKLYSWVDKESPDLDNYKAGKFTYYYRGVVSEKAFWVFDLNSDYRPGAKIMKKRLLLSFDFGPQTESVIKNESNFIDFESTDFKGETKHKNQVIVKSNEKGAYGIGALMRGFLSPTIALASTKEVAKALGLSEREIADKQSW